MVSPQHIKTTDNTLRRDVIQVDHVYKSFGKNHVLADFSLNVMEGESVVLLGKSGAGKSVLIKCIIGLMRPDKGTIRVFGDNVVTMRSREMDKLRSKVGFLFQSNALYDSMTIRENLEFPLRRHEIHYNQEAMNELVMSALEDVGLPHTVDMMPSELSGGMRKRVALARTIILRPKIILYDEPTTGLDTITGKEIISLMMELQHKYHTSSLIISHDMNCVRLASDRISILWKGKNYITGQYNDLLHTDDEVVKQFFE